MYFEVEHEPTLIYEAGPDDSIKYIRWGNFVYVLFDKSDPTQKDAIISIFPDPLHSAYGNFEILNADHIERWNQRSVNL